MKSIRKNDVKTTAKELGVKEGDRFVVLSPEESYKGEEFDDDYCRVGDTLILWYDDNTWCPRFKNAKNGQEFYESFSCLTHFEGADDTQADDNENKINLTVVETSFGPNYDKDDDTMLCKLEVDNITFEQYQKLLSFINTL